MPKLTPLQIIGIILVINGALIGSTAQLTDVFGIGAAKMIVSIASIANSIFGGIVTLISGQGSQVRNVLAMPGIEDVTVNAKANPTLAAIAVDPTEPKIAPTAAASHIVTETAKGI